jgi:hypothetical protein
MVPVRGEITSKNHGTHIDRYSMSIALTQAGRALVHVRCRGTFSLQLPPGDYQLSYRAPDCIAAKGSASVTAGATELDLGTTDLEPTMLSQLSGKAPPEWSVSDARGVSRSVKLADYRGKWVLLEFWGFW